MIFYSTLLLLGGLIGASSGNHTLAQAFPGFAGTLTGLVIAYAFLYWSTKQGGWLGLP